MANRKIAIGNTPKRPDLQRLLDKAKESVITDEQLQQQRVSFIYGNAPEGSGITKESAKRAASRIRVADES